MILINHTSNQKCSRSRWAGSFKFVEEDWMKQKQNENKKYKQTNKEKFNE